MRKIALITGIFGQDGAYLAELLLKKNYIVIGTSKTISIKKFWRLKKLKIDKKIIFEKLDICETKDIEKILKKHKINEIYNFAAQSYVNKSLNLPLDTTRVNALGVIKILEVVRKKYPKIKFYQASSSEMFGKVNIQSLKNNENFNPQSPYAVSKLFGHHITKNYRSTYKLYAISGILFNHESPLRSNDFVLKKISNGLVNIINKKQKIIELGNINIKRDWGYAKEFIPYIWKMMQNKVPRDFVLATGKSHSIKEFIDIAVKYLKLNVKWIGSGLNQKLILKKNNKIIIKIKKKYFRSSDINHSRIYTKKITNNLKWSPKTSFKELVKLMIEDEKKNFNKNYKI